MEIEDSDLLIRMIISIPFGIGAAFLFIKVVKVSNRFFFWDYQGNSKERFRENLYSSMYMGLGIACLMVAVFWFQTGVRDIKSFLEIIPVAICIGALVIPIGVLGAYWHSYQMNKLWGGFLPMARAWYGYPQSESGKQQKIDPSKIKVPRRVTITAAGIALFIFFGMLFLLSKVQWNGPAWAGILTLILFSVIMSFGVFMMIISASLSRRIQKLRDGDLLDDD